MPRTTKAEAAAQAAVAMSVMGGGTLNRVQFMFAMNELLKRLDKAVAHKAARELEARIAVGEEKIATAKASAKAAQLADRIAEAEMTLSGLRGELTALRRDLIIPHTVLHMIHYLLDLHDRQEWPITSNGAISINLPGIVSIKVEVPTTGIPF